MTENEERQLDEAVEARLFLRDKRHLWLAETDDNFDALGRFLDDHGLPVTAENLHRGYEELVARGELELIPHATDTRAAYDPATPQATVQAAQESEVRLHAVERRPGESAWMAAQRAYAEQQIAEQRRARQLMRTEMQNVPTDATRLAAAREANNQYAKSMRPYGKGAAFITGKEE